MQSTLIIKPTQRRCFWLYRRWESSRGDIPCTPNTHLHVFTTSLFNVETTWISHLCQHSGTWAPLAFSVAAHESIWPHEGRGTEPRSLTCSSRIFVFLFLMKHLNKYWSNLLSCHGQVHAHACAHTHTCTHNLSSQASGISLCRALWWLGRATSSTVPGKGDWNQRGTWTEDQLGTAWWQMLSGAS